MAGSQIQGAVPPDLVPGRHETHENGGGAGNWCLEVRGHGGHAADTGDHQEHRAQGQSGAEAGCWGMVYTPMLASPPIPCSQQYCDVGPTISHVRFLEASFPEQVRTVRCQHPFSHGEGPRVSPTLRNPSPLPSQATVSRWTKGKSANWFTKHLVFIEQGQMNIWR